MKAKLALLHVYESLLASIQMTSAYVRNTTSLMMLETLTSLKTL